MTNATASDSSRLDVGEGRDYLRANGLLATHYLAQAVQALLAEYPVVAAEDGRALVCDQLACLLGMEGGDWDVLAEELVDEVLAEEAAAAS